MEFNINSSKLFWQYQLQFQQFNKKSAISILLLIVKFVILNINFNINMVFSQLQLQCRYQYFRNYSCNINSDTIPIVLQQFQQFFQQPFQYGTIVHPCCTPLPLHMWDCSGPIGTPSTCLQVIRGQAPQMYSMDQINNSPLVKSRVVQICQKCLDTLFWYQKSTKKW